MHDAITSKGSDLAVLCRRFGIARLEVFGSAARAGDFDRRTSDADFLVTFAPSRKPRFADLFDLEDALAKLLGRPVDIVEREAIETSHNYLRRRQILAEAEPVYEG